MFTLKLSFNPQERDHKKNLELVNAALDTMKLSEINIKNIKSYTVQQKPLMKMGNQLQKNISLVLMRSNSYVSKKMERNFMFTKWMQHLFQKKKPKIIKNFMISGKKGIQIV